MQILSQATTCTQIFSLRFGTTIITARSPHTHHSSSEASGDYTQLLTIFKTHRSHVSCRPMAFREPNVCNLTTWCRMKSLGMEPPTKPGSAEPDRPATPRVINGWAATACKCHEKLPGFGNPSTWAAGHPAETFRSAGTEPGTALCNFLTRSIRKRERN